MSDQDTLVIDVDVNITEASPPNASPIPNSESSILMEPSPLANGLLSSRIHSESQLSSASGPEESEGKHARFKVENVEPERRTSKELGRRLSPAGLEHNEHTLHDLETIGYATHEALPLTVFYRNQSSMEGQVKARPTLAELHKGFDELDEQQDQLEQDENYGIKAVEDYTDPDKRDYVNLRIRFGWIKGVLVPCLLNIWGVILYLRLPRLTGQAGMALMTVIILLSAVVTTITTLSMSAICTNGEVKGGGAYFLISRSLGPEFGGSIGIIFSLANAVGVALYVVGFGETVQQLMAKYDVILVDPVNDVRIIGLVVVLLLLLITLVGLGWVIKTQIFLLALLILSMISYFVGSFTGSVFEKKDVLKSQGFTSYSTETFKSNLMPEFRGESFFDVFSIFFPAATGILAGVNISGDLKDPQRAVPKGTFSAILLTTIVYIGLAWVIGASTLKDANGVVSIVTSAAASVVVNNSKNKGIPPKAVVPLSQLISNCSLAKSGKCNYGLLHDPQLMERFSIVGPLVLAGIFAATLSSALASLVGSPKTFQAVCRDGIFKGLGFFGVGSGLNDEPRRAYVLTFVISSGFIALGQLDIIAPIISNFFLMSYALINYSVFAASLGRSPGWRPSFKYYNMWLSLAGGLVCIAIMFLINWWAALVTVIIVMALYKYVDYKKPRINWGSSGQAHTYIKALKFAHLLNRTDTHVKNFRPQCLALTGSPSSRPNLTHFVSHITKHVGLMICGNVVISKKGSPDCSTEKAEKWLREKKIKAFVTATSASSLKEGAHALMQCSGIGKLQPNILVLGYKTNWQEEETNDVCGYIDIIHDAFDQNLNVAILRLPQGFAEGDFSDDESMCGDDEPDMIQQNTRAELPPLPNETDDSLALNDTNLEADESCLLTDEDVSFRRSNPSTPMQRSLREGSKRKHNQIVNTNGELLLMEEKKKGYIDVWWLFDDGGLTVLLPYLISRSKNWSGCSLRVFTPSTGKGLRNTQVRMAGLLKKFRIDFSGIVEVKGINEKPSKESLDEFKSLPIKEELDETNGHITKKTLQQVRLGELLREHSKESKLVVVTLPVPRKTVVSNLLYMSWLETISRDLESPILLVRGNQESVLTFYS